MQSMTELAGIRRQDLLNNLIAKIDKIMRSKDSARGNLCKLFNNLDEKLLKEYLSKSTKHQQDIIKIALASLKKIDQLPKIIIDYFNSKSITQKLRVAIEIIKLTKHNDNFSDAVTMELECPKSALYKALHPLQTAINILKPLSSFGERQKETSPIATALINNLMRLHDTEKGLEIAKAIYNLSSNSKNLSKDLANAVYNPNSELYLALNIKRVPIFFNIDPLSKALTECQEASKVSQSLRFTS